MSARLRANFSSGDLRADHGPSMVDLALDPDAPSFGHASRCPHLRCFSCAAWWAFEGVVAAPAGLELQRGQPARCCRRPPMAFALFGTCGASTAATILELDNFGRLISEKRGERQTSTYAAGLRLPQGFLCAARSCILLVTPIRTTTPTGAPRSCGTFALLCGYATWRHFSLGRRRLSTIQVPGRGARSEARGLGDSTRW